MRIRWAPIAALLLSLCLFGCSVKVWMGRATPLERENLVDYARQQFGMSRIPGISPKTPLPLSWMRETLYGGKDIQLVLFWPLVVSGIGTFALLLLARAHESRQEDQELNGKVLRGPRLVTHWQFNLRTLFKRKGAFYIEVE